jgi:energy-coupling factor transport system ATP-binding protein
MISLVGANGAGKSTLSRLMTGEEKPQSGHIYWKGNEISDIDADEAENYVGYVPQNPKDSLSQETVYEEIALKMKQRNMPEEEIVRKVDEVAKVCGLQYIKDLPLSMLSFGQLKRVSIAAVLALDPELIILDEPAAGQDFSHYKDIMHFLQQIHQNGVTVVIVTHDMHLMLEYTRRAVVMAKGKIVADTSSAFVLINPRLIQIASLKETTLFTFANQIGMTDPYSFTEKFVYYDRAARLF